VSERELMRSQAEAELKLAGALTALAREYLRLSRSAAKRAEKLIHELEKPL
jgi:hypothetical protein